MWLSISTKLVQLTIELVGAYVAIRYTVCYITMSQKHHKCTRKHKLKKEVNITNQSQGYRVNDLQHVALLSA